ncbi:MAG: RNA polymerase sigma factor [Acidobacteria bacterium]|nr:RNA polymerase sigma factor [Acidobacteriota bacterium]
MEDKTLLKEYLNGNEKAFEMILSKYEGKVIKLLYRLTGGNKELSMDLSQETFLRFIKAASDLKGESTLGTWLYRVAYNIYIDFIRKNEGEKVELEENVASVNPHSEENIAGREIKEKIMISLSKLPKEQAVAIYLFYFEDFSLKEICKVLNSSEGKVKTLLFRGREHLSKLVA